MRVFLLYNLRMALSWSGKRQVLYFLLVLGVIFAFLLIILWPQLNKEPTCFDGKQNGDEFGIDCGGSCQKVCTESALNLVTLWTRHLEVTPGKYNLMAMIQNQNREAGIPEIAYTFEVYDENNIYIGKIDGTTFINSNDQIVIFEPGFDAGTRTPFYVLFKFTTFPSWINVPRSERNALALSTEDKVLTDPFDSPKLTAVVSNNTLKEMKDLDVFAVLYDDEGNVLNASKTFIERLEKNAKSNVVFTWPNPLPVRPARIDILPQPNVFLFD